MNCRYCQYTCKKKGFQKNGKQKFQCKTCFKYQQEQYSYTASAPDINSQIKRLVKRGAGIHDISYVTNISATTVIKRIRYLACGIRPPAYFPLNHDYEMDELQTYIWEKNKKREFYIAYAISKQNGQVVSYTIGGRDRITLGKTVNKILLNYPKTIYTDGWAAYPSIMPKEIHVNTPYRINHIERRNLTVRTQFKRLSKNRLCQSKKYDMLDACLKIYFWG